MAIKKTEKTPPITCEKCGMPMTVTEVRSYREALYGIDPHNKDKRRWCKNCKETK